jgi:hypothetical protein
MVFPGVNNVSYSKRNVKHMGVEASIFELQINYLHN